MKALLLMLLFLPLANRGGQDPKPLLRITIDGWGVVWPQGKHNYLTVWRDGTVTYLEKSKRGLTAQVTDGINRDKLDKLKTLLREVSKLKINLPASSIPLDYRMTVDIQVADNETLEIPHYSFDQANQVPAVVYKLLCFSDTIRDEPYRLTKPAACNDDAP